MPTTYFSTASMATACLAATCFASPALAQGALKPVDALIVNPPSRPVPVAVISAPVPPGEGAREVFSTAYSLIFSNNFIACTGGSVPTGKRLVLEHMSASAGSMGSAALSNVSLADQIPRLFIPAGPPVGSGMGAAGQTVRAYLDGPFTVCATAHLNNNGFVTVVLNGYVVPRP
jgi:hypothetical protein